MSGQDSCQDNAWTPAITQFRMKGRGGIRGWGSPGKLTEIWAREKWTKMELVGTLLGMSARTQSKYSNAVQESGSGGVINLSLIACEIRDRRSICLLCASPGPCLCILLFVFVILRGSFIALLCRWRSVGLHQRDHQSNSCRSLPPKLNSFSQLELRPAYWISYCNLSYPCCLVAGPSCINVFNVVLPQNALKKLPKIKCGQGALVCCSLNWNNWHERFPGPTLLWFHVLPDTQVRMLLRLVVNGFQPPFPPRSLRWDAPAIGWVAPFKLQQFILHYSAWMAFSLQKRAAKEKNKERNASEKSSHCPSENKVNFIMGKSFCLSLHFLPPSLRGAPPEDTVNLNYENHGERSSRPQWLLNEFYFHSIEALTTPAVATHCNPASLQSTG